MKLFMIHCGFYDPDVGDGIYESHVNLFVAAQDTEDAKKRVRSEPLFAAKKMHVDGIQLIESAGAYAVSLQPR